MNILVHPRFCISTMMCSFSGATSGRPMKARASAGVQSMSTVTFTCASRGLPILVSLWITLV